MVRTRTTTGTWWTVTPTVKTMPVASVSRMAVAFTVGNLCQREEPLLTADTPDTISGCHWPEKMAPRQAES